jgi:hypothetical protein
MPNKVVIDDGRRCRKGTRVAFVPAEPGSRIQRMVEDEAGPFTLRSTASLRMGSTASPSTDETKLLHVTVKRKKTPSKDEAAR